MGPISLPWNFTKELQENDQKMDIFQQFLCKIIPL